VAVHADASTWCAPLQVSQTVHGEAPLALKVLPGTQLPPALETQSPPESVKPAAQPQTASEEAVQAERMVCCAPLQAAHVEHALVFEPADENVPAAHATTTASVVGVHGVAMRWPGPAAAQAWHVGSAKPGLVAKKAPAHTHEEWSIAETE
jgi:hypothetical protein